MDVCTGLSATSNLSIDPLRNDSNINALKTFEDIIRTSIGPFGKLKAVQNAAGGHVTLSSSSQRLLHIISLKNTFLKLIVSTTKIHLNCFRDNGFCCSLLILKLINNSLSATYPLPVIGKLFEYFGKLFIEFLNVNENVSVLNLDLSNLAYFQCIVSTILRSKPGCIFSEEGVQHLCVLLIKIFLNCLPSTSSPIGHKNINFISLEGTTCDKSGIHEGLLVSLSDMPLKNLPYLLNTFNLKVVLFTSSLSGDAEFPVGSIEVTNDVDVWEAVLKFMKSFFEKLIKAKIHVLACQKVVHPSLKKQLEDANILVLDRLGYETSKHLEYLLGASNSSLFDEPSYGYLSSMHKVTIGKKNFLALSNEKKPFWTMSICNFNEEAVAETKVVCQQVIDTLFRLLKKPFVLFGAGCTEIHTSKLVEQKVLQSLKDIQQETGCTTSQILEALQIFLCSVKDLAVAFHQGTSLNFATESAFGHLWKLKDGSFPPGSDKCACGLFSASQVKPSDWKMFSRSISTVAEQVDFHPIQIDTKISNSLILDELSSKVNAYSLAFETASLLLRVSVCAIAK